jgi:mannitol-1-phosphate 5-dehydrogenase
MQKAVMYGAGNIGRGFIGKVFSESGLDVLFIDVVQEVIDQLNKDGQYPVKLVSNEAINEVIVKNASAVSGMDKSAVVSAILNADIMATAVGVNILPRIVDNIAAGIDARAQANKPPLDIIICENLIDADKYLRSMLEEKVLTESRKYLDSSIGLVEASIGRMVPVMTDEMRGDNPLRVVVEPYEKLPVDKDAFRGEIPHLNNLVPFSPFGFYIRRKLFVHNMGHALCAYYGWLKGYEYVYESVEDEEIAAKAKVAMLDSAAALSRDYHIPFEEIEANVYDLIRRFGNRVLKDTNARVGGDPIRKLKKTDRLAGAALYCIEQGVGAENIVQAIAAGYCFDNPADNAAVQIQQFIADYGIEKAVEQYSGIEGALRDQIVAAYNKLKK